MTVVFRVTSAILEKVGKVGCLLQRNTRVNRFTCLVMVSLFYLFCFSFFFLCLFVCFWLVFFINQKAMGIAMGSSHEKYLEKTFAFNKSILEDIFQMKQSACHL